MSKDTLTEKDITVEALVSANDTYRLYRYYGSMSANADGYERYVADGLCYAHVSDEEEHLLSYRGEDWSSYERWGDVYSGVAYIGDADGRAKTEFNPVITDGAPEDEKLISSSVADSGYYLVETEWTGNSYEEYGRRYKGYIEGGYARCFYTVEPYYWVVLEKEIRFFNDKGELKNTVTIDMEDDTPAPEKSKDIVSRFDKANVTVTLVVEPDTENEKTYHVLTDARNDIRIKCGKNQTAVLFTDRECTKRYYPGHADLSGDRTVYVKLGKTSEVTLEDVVNANSTDNILSKYKSVLSVRNDSLHYNYREGTGENFMSYDYIKYAGGNDIKSIYHKGNIYFKDGNEYYSTVYLSPETEEDVLWKNVPMITSDSLYLESVDASVDNGDGTVTVYTSIEDTELFESVYPENFNKPYTKGDIALFMYTVDKKDLRAIRLEEQVNHVNGETESMVVFDISYNAAKPLEMLEIDEHFDISGGFKSGDLRHIDFVLNPGSENEKIYTGYAKKGEYINCTLRTISEDGRVTEYTPYFDSECAEECFSYEELNNDSYKIYLKEKRKDGNISYASSVTSEMCSPEYWIKRAKNPDRILMYFSDILALNKEMLAESGANMHDLENMTETYNVKSLGTSLSNLENTDKANYYVDGVKVTDKEEFFSGIRENILSGGSVAIGGPASVGEDTADNAYAVCVKRAELRIWPLSEYIGYSAADTDDEAVNAVLDVNEPFVARYMTGDGKFVWGYSNNCTGWVEVEKLAICADKAEWLDAWKVKNQRIIVVTGDKVRLEKSVLDPEVSETELMIGTCLKLVPQEDIPEKIGERGTWNNYVVYMPVRNSDGSYRKRMALISQKADVNVGYLPLTQANVLKVALGCLGNRYGWGGMLGAMDCSLFNRSVYRCFGLEIPRNTTWQQSIPGKLTGFKAVTDNTEENTEKNQSALEDRKKLLDESPAGTMLYFQGHTMMYLGKENGKYYVISELGSLFDVGDTSIREVYSVAVNTLDVRRKNGSTWLANLCGIVRFG